MPLRYVIDENLRGTLAIALVRVGTRFGLSVDAMQIGDDAAPPRGTQDRQILIWAESENRILVSRDRRTLAKQLATHLAPGNQSPGIFLIRDEPLIQIAEYLLLLAFASDGAEWQNQITYVP